MFRKIHHSALVNARAIDGVTSDFCGSLVVEIKADTEKLGASRSYTRLFRGI